MNKAYRKGTAISVAFSSGLNCLHSQELAISQEQNPVLLDNSQSFFFRGLKKMLRPILRLIYPGLKRALRPLILRTRTYFTAELNQNYKNLQTMTSTLQESLELMQQELQQLSTQIQRQNKQIKGKMESCSLNCKIQTEIESFRAILNSNPNASLIVEFNQSQLKLTNHSTKQWLKTFEDLNLCYKVINEKTKALEDCSIGELENMELAKLFFARKNSTAWEKAAL
jgi:hypothetical protein